MRPPSHDLINGILKGYVIYYKSINSSYSVNETEANITSDADSDGDMAENERVINGLRKFTWYCVDIVAFTSVGSGDRTCCQFQKRTGEDGK